MDNVWLQRMVLDVWLGNCSIQFGEIIMARQFITPMGKHKPVRSSWAAMDTQAYSRSYEPESRHEFRVYVTGQADAMQAEYEAKLKREARIQAVLELKQKLLDKNLL
jgi:hypothetical protein